MIGAELFDLWEDTIAILSPDGVISYTNKNWKQFAQDNGLNPDECDEGTNYLKVCDEARGQNSNEASIASEGIREVISGKKSIFKIEYPCHSPGERRWFLLKVTPLSKESPTNVLLQHIDITGRKLAEEETIRSKDKFRDIFSESPIPIEIYNSEGHLTDANTSYLKLFGISDVAEVQSFNLFDDPNLPADAREQLLAGETVEYENTFDFELVKKLDLYNTSRSGTIYVNVKISALCMTGYLVHVQDITKQKKHEEKIKLFKTIFDNANSGNAITDLDGNIKYVNDCFAKNHGFEPDELIGQNLSIFHNEEQMTDVSSINKSLLEDGYYTNVEVWHTHRNGTTFPMLMTGIIIEDELQNPQFIAATAIDITEMKDKEYKLRESEAKFRSYINNAPDGIFVADENGYYIDVNNAACDITGYSKNELIGMHLLDLLPPDVHKYVINKFEDVKNKGKADIEIPYLTKDGDKRWWRVTAAALSENRIIGFVEDITQHQKNLQRLDYLTDTLRCIRDVNQIIVKESNSYDLLQKICDNLTKYNTYAAAWIGIFDENNKINMITESGYSNKFDDFLEYTKTNMPHCAQCALEASDYIIIENPEKECSGCPLHNEYGREDVFVSKIEYGNKVYGTIALTIPEDYVSDEEIIDLSREVVDDISFSLYNLELEALRQTAKESLLEGKLVAEEANRTKSEFLANMSHELRTPLNSVIGFSQVLEENASNHLDDKEIKYVSNVLKSGDYLLELINDILDISKVESGNMDYVPESVNIEEIIDGTITLVSPMAKKKAIDLHVSFKHEYPDMQADRMKFKEIMYNLLSNAIKFTPEKGEVQVTTKIIDEKLHVSVSDTGIGIPEGKFKSIFDPFEQVDSSANRKFGGTGLGLSLVKKYVEMHDGEVWVESEIGKGSTFTFTVPLV
ncbi:PAS domain S-box protein [Methanohalophilus profundi]|uniref:PAS domain S-box protein n=1 Tax=Methanohalophilus profundi TaxID=2138083 RepID=UPI00101C802B|nr:PAS domain S-box protein [Methanohalophilus profundi]